MDIIDMGRYFGALLIVAGLAALALAGTKRFGFAALTEFAKRRGVTTPRRLAIVEGVTISPRQRLLLVRRDDVLHLIAVGPDGVHLIEQAIPAADHTTEATP